MAMEGAADIIKQLKDEIDKEGGDPDGLHVLSREGEVENATEEPKRAEAKQEETAEQTSEDEGADSEEPGEDQQESTEDDALSNDARKRGKAFGEMRQKIKAAEERAEKLEIARQEQAERLARLEGRAEASAPVAKAQEDAEPDALLYPDDHNQWQLRQIKKENAEIKKMAQDAMGFANYQKEERGVSMLEDTFKVANPKEDYDGAQRFLIERERTMKKLMNPKITDAEADAQTRTEKVSLFKALYAQGRDPAQVVVDMAKAQGYNPGAAKGSKEVVSKTNLEKVAENQRRSTNLMGGSPAGKGKQTLSSDDVLGMSFSKLLKLPKAERERLANGGDE